MSRLTYVYHKSPSYILLLFTLKSKMMLKMAVVCCYFLNFTTLEVRIAMKVSKVTRIIL